MADLPFWVYIGIVVLVMVVGFAWCMCRMASWALDGDCFPFWRGE